MKQYNRIILGVTCSWLLIIALTALWLYQSNLIPRDKAYMVEINRIQEIFTEQGTFSEIELSDYNHVIQIDYLPVYADSIWPASKIDATAVTDYYQVEGIYPVEAFFKGFELNAAKLRAVPQQCEFNIRPFYREEALAGFIRYSYITEASSPNHSSIIIAISAMSILYLIILGILLYIRRVILKPFHEISELPYELSKGHLPKDMKETKNRYFGKFIWGLNLLRENLEQHKQKGLQLEKDKKLMILSISHDIKTPLSTIKLYSKALYEDLYTSQEKRHETAKKIEEKADQIESFVTEIIKTSSTELFDFEVQLGEFYLSKLVEAVRRAHEEKLALLKIEFELGSFQEKLLRGDFEKLIDVFDNLFQNAIKYGDGQRISLAFDEEDNYQLIRITNTGDRVSTTHLHHMFESFWRGENATGKPGNGLGLYICRQLLHKMEGEIYAEPTSQGMSLVVVLKKS